MADNTAFFFEVDQFQTEIENALYDEVRDIARQVLGAICDGNIRVIDTGRSTASWVASVGTPIEYIAMDITEFATVGEAQAKARSLETLTNLRPYKLGEPLYITNGNHYVVELEMGKSKRAPQGFIQLAMAGFPDIQFRLNITGGSMV